ncbi:MAG: hypothetical protein V8R81_00940 [Clostridia bacterium]
MIRVSEREIENCLKEFNKRDIVLKMKGIVIAEVKMELARCVYNRTVGILEVSNNQTKFEFNISCLYRMTVSSSGTTLRMYFDNGIHITIDK